MSQYLLENKTLHQLIRTSLDNNATLEEIYTMVLEIPHYNRQLIAQAPTLSRSMVMEVAKLIEEVSNEPTPPFEGAAAG